MTVSPQLTRRSSPPERTIVPIRRCAAATAMLAIACAAYAENRAIEAYRTHISPILEQHCYECHGDGYDKGRVAFDALESDAEILDSSLWLKVLNNTRAGLMPADDNPRLPAAEQETLERWIKRDVFGIDPAHPDPGRVTVRRLNRVEYRNTIRDLVGVDYNTAYEFPPDDTGFGFDNIGDALSMSPMLMEKYVAAAQAIVAQAVPLTPRRPAVHTIAGMALTGQNAGEKYGNRRLLFTEPASIASAFTPALPGTYRVRFELTVNGSYIPDPGRARVTLRVDGKQVAQEELVYHDEKGFVFESTHRWDPTAHEVSVELEPLAPAAKKETIIDLFVDRVTVEGPLEREHWVASPNYDRYFPRAIPVKRAEQRAYATGILTAFATRAYRRPLTDDTGARLAALAEDIYMQDGKSFEQGIAHAIAAVLASPRFLFRFEVPAAGARDARVADIDEYSLASRLSYFLWSTMPDVELMDLAALGELRANLSAQIDRMMQDPRAANLARNFTGQWLLARDVEGIAINPRQIILRDLGREDILEQIRAAGQKQDTNTVDRLLEEVKRIVDTKPDFDAAMRKAMRLETEAYFVYVMVEDRPVTELIDSNYTFVNEDLAAMYGIPGVEGEHMRKVTLPPGHPRGGVLTQGTSLVVTSNPDRTSPVKRGLFVLSNFLGTPPPPPPANVPALEASETEFAGHEPLLRDVLKLHREDPRCASCHNRMDPIGLAFENFNAIGMWRDAERNQPIVAEGGLITGEQFDSVRELKRILANDHREEFYRTLTGKLLTYATGRGMEYYDVETIDRIVRQLDEQGGRFSVLLKGVIDSAPFQKMRTQATITAAN